MVRVRGGEDKKARRLPRRLHFSTRERMASKAFAVGSNSNVAFNDKVSLNRQSY
jgi:hypothetical protein